jgi:hypothetical protein
MITGKAMYEGPHSGVEAWIITMDGEIEDLPNKYGQCKTYKCLGRRETKLKQVRAYGRNGEVSMQKKTKKKEKKERKLQRKGKARGKETVVRAVPV